MGVSMKQTNLELETKLPEESEMHPSDYESFFTYSEQSAPEIETIFSEDSSQIEQKAEQVRKTQASLPSHSEKQPIDCLLEAVQSASLSTLISPYQDTERVTYKDDSGALIKNQMPVGVEHDLTTNRQRQRETVVVIINVPQSQAATYDPAAKNQVKLASTSTLTSPYQDKERVIYTDDRGFPIMDPMPIGVKQNVTTNRQMTRETEVEIRNVPQSQAATYDSAAKMPRNQVQSASSSTLISPYQDTERVVYKDDSGVVIKNQMPVGVEHNLTTNRQRHRETEVVIRNVPQSQAATYNSAAKTPRHQVKLASPSTLISPYQDKERVISKDDCGFPIKNPMPVGVKQNVTFNRHMTREIEVAIRNVQQSQAATYDSSVKTPRNQFGCERITEIKMMNDRLTETVIKVTCYNSNRTIVTCTYTPVTAAEDFKSKIAPEMAAANVSVDFLLPSDYPSSPRTFSYRPSEGLNFSDDFLKEIIHGFETRLTLCTDPLRVGNIAQAWNDSARSSFQDFATPLGAHINSSYCGSREFIEID